MNVNTNKNPHPLESKPEKKRVLESNMLFGEQREVVIKHGQQTYLLKITRQDKLILTK